MTPPLGLTPQAKSEGLVVSEVEDETLVYDLGANRAHTLNPAAALVWRNSDGENTVSDLAEMLTAELGIPADEDAVWHALAQLQNARLLIHPAAPSAADAEPSRREFMKGMGRVGAAAGVASVLSLAVPLAVAAASCGTEGIGVTCQTGTQCASCCCLFNGPVGTCVNMSVCQSFGAVAPATVHAT